MNILLLIAFISVVIILYGTVRNEQVYRERMRMNSYCYRKAVDDKLSIEVAWAAYEKYSYNEMMFKFWVPVENFYWEYLGDDE